MNPSVLVRKSRILKHPNIIRTILRGFPTLDPLVIFVNAPIYILSMENEMVGFVSVKKWGDTAELGTLYTHPQYRGKGYSKILSAEIIREYRTVYLLCKPDMVDLYLRHGFVVDNNPQGIMQVRKTLFDWFIRPFVGYNIQVMENAA